MRSIHIRAGMVLSLLTAVVVGCGGADDGVGPSASGDSTANSAMQAGEADLQAYSQCMRDNGIADFPDPGPNGIVLDELEIDSDSRHFRAAEDACEHLGPHSGPARSGSGNAGESEWERVVPGGDCQCADGSEFAFWEHRVDPTKVVLYLDGGGVCADATTCAFTGTAGESEFYNWSVEGENPAFPGGGILNFTRADNPFADYSFIYVGSCTGDVDLGDNTRVYSPELTVEHNGFVNGMAALNFLAEHYPDTDKVVVVGKTGGSVAAPVYGGLAADLLPDAHITVFGAQSGAVADDPEFNAEILGERWGAYDTMPDWEVNEGLTARDWGIPRFWIQAGLHDPDIVMARFDYAFDPNAAATVESMGVDASNLVALIDANEAAIEAAGVVQHSYTAPGAEHGILDLDTFYEVEVNGVRLVDWVEALLVAEPPDDVHCDECETP